MVSYYLIDVLPQNFLVTPVFDVDGTIRNYEELPKFLQCELYLLYSKEEYNSILELPNCISITSFYRDVRNIDLDNFWILKVKSLFLFDGNDIIYDRKFFKNISVNLLKDNNKIILYNLNIPKIIELNSDGLDYYNGPETNELTYSYYIVEKINKNICDKEFYCNADILWRYLSNYKDYRIIDSGFQKLGI